VYWTTLKILKCKKLKYFSAPPRDINALGRKAVVEIAERCQTLQPLDYQEGYFLDGEDISDCPWQSQADKPSHPILLRQQQYSDVR